MKSRRIEDVFILLYYQISGAKVIKINESTKLRCFFCLNYLWGSEIIHIFATVIKNDNMIVRMHDYMNPVFKQQILKYGIPIY